MAGERLAKQTLYIRQYALRDFQWVVFRLGGTDVMFTGRLGSGSVVPLNHPNTFTIMTVVNTNDVQRQTVRSFINAVQGYLDNNNLSAAYTVQPLPDPLVPGDLIGCTVEATQYDPLYDFPFPLSNSNFNGLYGIDWPTVRTATIRPVRVAVAVTNTGAFGTATGAITLTPSNGTDGTYTYFWADPGAPFTATRTGLAAGSYACTVTDASGASTVAVAVVASDTRLDVLIERTDNNVTLVPSGGVAPYAYAWLDGPTTATRQALAIGTYTCTVTDARGTAVMVTVDVRPYRFYWSKNPVTLALDAGAAYRQDPTTKPNLSFVCEVWVEEAYLSNTFTQVGPQQEQPADRTGRTVFDAQALLDNYLREHLPDLNQAAPSRADALFRRFYFRYAEKFGAVPVAAALSNQAQHYVVLGGLDFYAAAADTWFTSYQAGAQPFLTWEPTDKKVLATQPEYLYFMADSFALASFAVQVQVRYADGSTGRLRGATVAGVRRYEVYCLPVGYRALGLGPNPDGAEVASWEVWVSDGAGAPQTEHRRYVLETHYVAKPRYFLYTNSLGGVGTLACVGDAKTALDVKAEEADRPQGVGYDPLLGDTFTFDRSGVATLSVSSGPLNRADLVALQDLLLARRVTLQSDDVYWAGRVKAKAFALLDETPADATNLEFDFVLPRQRQFTPRLPATAAGQPVTPVRGGEGGQP